MPQIIARLIVAQQEQIVAGAATQRRRLPRIQRQQVQLVGDRVGLWINHDVYVTGAQTAAMTKEAKRKPRRNLETVHHHVAAPGKYLLDALFTGRAMRDIDEVTQSDLPGTRAPVLLQRDWTVKRASHLHQD